MKQFDKWAHQLRQIQKDTTNDMVAFFNLAEHMAKEIRFPLTADWLGKEVIITAVNLTYSSHSHGLKSDAEAITSPLPIEELIFIKPDPNSKEWLNFYRYFRENF